MMYFSYSPNLLIDISDWQKKSYIIYFYLVHENPGQI